MSEKTKTPKHNGNAQIFGEPGKLTHLDGKVQCHICGKFYGHLGGHVKRAHLVEADDYKKEFGLKMSVGLVGTDLLQKRRQSVAHLSAYNELSSDVLRNLTPEQRQNRYISLQEKEENRELKLASLVLAQQAWQQKCAETVELICPHCGQTYLQPKHNKSKRKFCSAACYFSSAQKTQAGKLLREKYGRGAQRSG